MKFAFGSPNGVILLITNTDRQSTMANYILADEGDRISFFVKEGEIIIRRSSSTDSGKQESNYQEPSSTIG